MKQLFTPLVISSAVFFLPFNATAEEARPYLTLDAAKAGAAACEAYAKGNNLRVAISIKDRAGRLVYFQRMDDVFQKQVEFAGIKAETAATTPLSTKRLAEVSSGESPLAGLVYIPGLTSVEGGEPITVKDNYNIGGIGVSGASPAQDGECARSAAAIIAKRYM